MRRVACLLGCAAASVMIAPAALASTFSKDQASTPSWTVYHGDPAGSGLAAGVRSVDTAARAWTSPALDGQLYGEPLAFGGRVYVATENDTVYALSAATGKIAWSVHLGTPVPAGMLPCGNISPVVGITGTPVIDQARHEIFVVASELAHGKPAHVLAGLNTATGQRELSRDVDPPGQAPSSLLQRTGLTIDAGRVYFGFGGNYGDCGAYRGRLVSVPEEGGTPRFFTVDAAPGDSRGAIWMGGAAPAVGSNGNLWVATGNGSVTKSGHPYDHSDGILELSPSLRLLQYFAPADWTVNNSDDLDMSAAPALLPDGQVIAAGKSGIVYLLDGARLGGIAGQQASLGPVCATTIDGGAAESGMTAYLPCTGGVVAVKVTAARPAVRLLWNSGVGGGPPIVAGGLVWTIGQNGTLYGLDPATSRIRQQAAIGTPANHFPTPGIGDGLLLATAARNVIAFATSPAAGASPTAAAATPAAQEGHHAPAGPAAGRHSIAGIAIACLIAVAAFGWFAWRIGRQRRN